MHSVHQNTRHFMVVHESNLCYLSIFLYTRLLVSLCLGEPCANWSTGGNRVSACAVMKYMRPGPSVSLGEEMI